MKASEEYHRRYAPSSAQNISDCVSHWSPWVRENHPLPDPLPAPPTTRLIQHRAYRQRHAADQKRHHLMSGTYIPRTRISRATSAGTSPWKNAPVCHTDYGSTPAIPAPQTNGDFRVGVLSADHQDDGVKKMSV